MRSLCNCFRICQRNEIVFKIFFASDNEIIEGEDKTQTWLGSAACAIFITIIIIIIIIIFNITMLANRVCC